MTRCAKCLSAAAPLVLAGVRGRSGGSYYVCLRHVGQEFARHHALCPWCRPEDPCDIASGLRAALRAMACLVPDSAKGNQSN